MNPSDEVLIYSFVAVFVVCAILLSAVITLLIMPKD